MLKLKLQHLGHLRWRTNSLEKTLMLGKIEGERRRGGQRTRWSDGITDSMDMSWSKLQMVKDREEKGGKWICRDKHKIFSTSRKETYLKRLRINIQFSSVTQSCLTLCNPTDCSTPGFPVLHHLREFVQTHVDWVSDAIQPSHPLLSHPPAFDLFQH